MSDKIKSTPEAWESGELGQDEKYVKKADVDESTLEESLELQMISIRLQKSLIDDLKNFAQLEELGYQPLIKRVLQRFVDGEKKRIANQYIADKIQAKNEALQAEKEASANMEDEGNNNKKLA